MLYIGLQPGRAVKIGNAPMKITGASGREISGYYNLDRGQVEWERNCDAHKKKVDVNYYITQCTGNSISWGSDELEIRCSRENQHPESLGPQASGWAAQENGKETQLWPI